MADDDLTVRLQMRDRARFSADARRAAEDVEQIGDEARRSSRLLSGLGTIGRGVGRALGRGLKYGAIGAATGIGLIGGLSVKAAIEAEGALAQTKAAIKSTGGVANVTKKDVTGLAESIMGYSGISDEAVQETENMLLTFTKVRNEVGKGNAVFDLATKRIADMSAKGFDLRGASIMVGKALNDPLKGMTAMSRAGVQFTKQQQTQIEKLVENNDLLGAQKIILGELETQFGGSAKAMGKTAQGTWNILKETVGNVLEDIGKPILELAKGVLPSLTPVIVEVFESLGPPVTKVVSILGKELGPVIKALSPVLAQLAKVFALLIKEAAPIIVMLAKIAAPIMRELMPALKPLIRALGDALLRALVSVAPVLPELAKSLADLVIAIAPLLPYLGTLIGFFVKIDLIVKSQLVRVLAKILKPTIESIIDVVRNLDDTWDTVWGNVTSYFERIAGRILDAAAWAFGWIPGIGDDIKQSARDFHNATDSILGDVQRARGPMGSFLNTVNAAIGNMTVGGGGSGGAAEPRARGGRVWPGHSYLVGEFRPEVYVPDRAGRIEPDASRFGGVHIHAGAIQIIGVSDPERAADLVLRKIQDRLALT